MRGTLAAKKDVSDDCGGMGNLFIVSILGIAVVLPGCVSIPKNDGLENVSRSIESRTGVRVQRALDPFEKNIEKAVKEIIDQPLTEDAAVQLGLLNNRNLQAVLEGLGIESADIAQASLPHNPVVGARTRFLDKAGLKTNTEFSLEQNFMDIIFAPLRLRLARAQFKNAQLEVSDKVFRLALEIKTAYYTLQGARQILLMRQNLFKTREAALELTRRQRQAGNISELDLANEKAMYYQAKLELARSQAEARASRENLNRFFGFSSSEVPWTIAVELAPIPETEPSLEYLESLALSQRLDLIAARQEVEIQEEALFLSRFSALRQLKGGIDTEKGTDGERLTGPLAEVEVPIFDRGQFAVHGARSRLRQSQHRLAVIENETRSDVRLAIDRLLTLREMINDYREHIIPAHEEAVSLSQKNYNFMLLGAFALLKVKQNEIHARREYIEALRDYWIARANLERAIGGKLPLGPSAAGIPLPEKETRRDHYHH